MLWRYWCGFFFDLKVIHVDMLNLEKRPIRQKKSWTNCILPVVETDHFSSWIICMLHTLNHLTWQVDGSLWSKADPSRLSFLSMLLCKRAGLRYSARRALRDDWLRKIGGRQLFGAQEKRPLRGAGLGLNRRGWQKWAPTEGDFFRDPGIFLGQKRWIFNVQPVPVAGNKSKNFCPPPFFKWYLVCTWCICALHYLQP